MFFEHVAQESRNGELASANDADDLGELCMLPRFDTHGFCFPIAAGFEERIPVSLLVVYLFPILYRLED